MNFAKFASDYKVRTKPHPWSKPYTSTCLKKGCREKPLFKDNIYYSLCDGCLKQESLGPYFRNNHKENNL